MSPLYLPICGITLPFQVNLHVSPLKFQMSICFVYAWTAHGARGGGQYLPFYVGYSHDEYLFTRPCTRGAGNRDAQSRNQKLQIIK